MYFLGCNVSWCSMRRSPAVRPRICACRASPQSLALTFEQLARGRRLHVGDALRMEFRLAAHLCARYPSEMHEGVRCRLIDRGAEPAWRFARVEDVPASAVAAFCEPVPGVPDLALPAARL
jgi:Enoyl-CoA hydratase/isomerase